MNHISADLVQAALVRMKPRPLVEMYPGDWLRDPIAGCSLAANGLWWRMTMVMHDARPYAHLVGNNGIPLSDQQAALRCGCRSASEWKKVLAEIDAVGIPGRTGDDDYRKILVREPIEIRGAEWTIDLSPLAIETTGVIYSRRMLRDRILSLVRFFVSPTGQRLITSAPAAPTVEPQPATIAPAPTADGAGRIAEALDRAGMILGGGYARALETEFGVDYVVAVIDDVGPRLMGKRPDYLRAIVRNRLNEGWTPSVAKPTPVYREHSRARVTVDEIREVRWCLENSALEQLGCTADEARRYLAEFVTEDGEIVKDAPTLQSYLGREEQVAGGVA